MKFTFIDKEQLCVYKDGKTEKYESEFIRRYRETSKRDIKSKEWKKNSDMMLYEGEFERNDRVVASVNSLSPTLEENKLVYTFSVNETSGIYYKFTDDEKKTEAHLLSSSEESFSDVTVNACGELCGCVQKDPLTSDIAVFSKDGGDYKSVTGGDSKDEHPFFVGNGEILFNSYGVGRDVNNEFVKYMPSEILKLNVHSMEIETLISDGKNSYIKPVLDSFGNLYCIKKPSEGQEKRNVFLEILLIPVRIVEALVGFISLFVKVFSGKPLMGGKGKTRSGGGAARNADERKIFIHNHMLSVEEELKRNQKEQDAGFIPRGWKLVKIPKNEDDFSVRYDHGMAQELAFGVADFCLTEENGQTVLIYTNGKRIFAIYENGEKKKLAHTDFCIKLGAVQGHNKESGDDLFDRL